MEVTVQIALMLVLSGIATWALFTTLMFTLLRVDTDGITGNWTESAIYSVITIIFGAASVLLYPLPAVI